MAQAVPGQKSIDSTSLRTMPFGPPQPPTQTGSGPMTAVWTPAPPPPAQPMGRPDLLRRADKRTTAAFASPAWPSSTRRTPPTRQSLRAVPSSTATWSAHRVPEVATASNREAPVNAQGHRGPPAGGGIGGHPKNVHAITRVVDAALVATGVSSTFTELDPTRCRELVAAASC